MRGAAYALLGTVQTFEKGFCDFAELQWTDKAARCSGKPEQEAYVRTDRVQDFFHSACGLLICLQQVFSIEHRRRAASWCIG